MSSPIEYQIDVYRGDDTEPITVAITDQAVDGSGNPLWEDAGHTIPTPGDPKDFTDCTIAGQIRKDATIGSPVLGELDVAFSDDPTDGTFTVAISHAVSETLEAKSHRYDVQVTNAAGRRKTYLKGPLVVDGDITRDE